jgi:hypothetical protein
MEITKTDQICPNFGWAQLRKWKKNEASLPETNIEFSWTSLVLNFNPVSFPNSVREWQWHHQRSPLILHTVRCIKISWLRKNQQSTHS